MQKGIHPQIYTDAVVTCACGSTFTTISTRKTISVEICSACHPYFTGKQRFVDAEGRIEKFARKMKESDTKKDAALSKKAERATKAIRKAELTKPNLKELLKTSKESK